MSGFSWFVRGRCAVWLLWCASLACAGGHAVAGTVSVVTGYAGQGVKVAAAHKVAHKKGKHKALKQAQPAERTPSGESVKARERRLLRECRGRPNAGACLGYAS